MWLFRGRRALGERRRALLPDLAATTAPSGGAAGLRRRGSPDVEASERHDVPGRPGPVAVTTGPSARWPPAATGPRPSAGSTRRQVACPAGCADREHGVGVRRAHPAPGRRGRRLGVVVAGVAAPLVGLVALSAAFSLGPYVVTGVADGAIYALAALGLVLTFKTSGIFNFAIGAQAAASAYVFYSFRESLGLPWPVAALCAMLLVGLVGSLILERIAYLFTGRAAGHEGGGHHRTAGVAAVGPHRRLRVGHHSVPPPSCRPRACDLFGVNVLGSQIIVVTIALVATVGLYVFFKRTRLGVSMQAVVDSPTLLALRATNPARRASLRLGHRLVLHLHFRHVARTNARHRHRTSSFSSTSPPSVPPPWVVLEPAGHLRCSDRHRCHYECRQRQARGAVEPGAGRALHPDTLPRARGGALAGPAGQAGHAG